MSTVNRKCERCQAPFTARSADVRRGWGRFCSKSCKATEQEARTGQHAMHQIRKEAAGQAQEFTLPAPGYFDYDGGL